MTDSTRHDTPSVNATLSYRHPTISDGPHLWRIANDTGVLDVNSPYAYALWCRDFSATSVIVRTENQRSPVSFITGYIRPDDPAVLMVWQVAVDEAARGQRIARTMLDWLFDRVRVARPEVGWLETTITEDNIASRRLFTSFAQRRNARLERSVLFDTNAFPAHGKDTHDAEVLHRIGPIDR